MVPITERLVVFREALYELLSVHELAKVQDTKPRHLSHLGAMRKTSAPQTLRVCQNSLEQRKSQNGRLKICQSLDFSSSCLFCAILGNCCEEHWNLILQRWCEYHFWDLVLDVWKYQANNRGVIGWKIDQGPFFLSIFWWLTKSVGTLLWAPWESHQAPLRKESNSWKRGRGLCHSRFSH